LFKSEFTEPHRVELSKLSGFDIKEVNSSTFEFSQDFKEPWFWIILHQIGKVLAANEHLADPPDILEQFLTLVGLRQPIFKKVLGYFPILKSGKVTITGDLGPLKTVIEQSYEQRTNEIPLYDINLILLDLLKRIWLHKRCFVIFDELEVFFHQKDQYNRDLMMVRDMIFAIKKLNEFFLEQKLDIFLLAGLRTEILDAIGAQGQEISRTVYDYGELIAWHQSNRSLEHPLIQIIIRKLQTSETRKLGTTSQDVFQRYFPERVGNMRIENYLLDNSFFKPRDLIWRLMLAQRAEPDSDQFSQRLLENTFAGYSSKLWEEITYELSATYAPSDIRAIEGLLSGQMAFFHLSDFQNRLNSIASHSEPAMKLKQKRSADEIIGDLYRLGVVGNEFRDPTHGRTTHRWIFRGDSTPVTSRQMVLNRALWKHFSAIGKRPQA
jgi:hypothetical protein